MTFPIFIVFSAYPTSCISSPRKAVILRACDFFAFSQKRLLSWKWELSMERRPRRPTTALSLGNGPFPFNNSLLFVIPSVPGFPTSQLSPVPLMWFSSKRTTCSCSKPQPSTGNPGKPRDLRCAIRVPQIYRSTTIFPLSSRLPRRAVGPKRSVVERPAVSFLGFSRRLLKPSLVVRHVARLNPCPSFIKTIRKLVPI